MPTRNDKNAAATDAACADPSPTRLLKPVALLLARHEIRNLKRWFEEFDRDILLPILLGEIALHNIGARENGDHDPKSEEPCTGPQDCLLRPCNAYSIAAATGLPRETVRRKISRLIELGWISRRENGHLFVTHEALTHFGSLLASRQLGEIVETADRARRLLGE
ncbi:hypothetical protein [Thauera sp. 2A1]|uniref:hypothetical protein n=1 Tax=Thauera sp. 2A1 TaxID=2570191 RepID=UPI001D176E0F|nr:hypothetical protein [Thauera sp. 2A1]KAI5913190.1 hypothetical protein GH664_18925 [Thauera sp. 2A1]